MVQKVGKLINFIFSENSYLEPPITTTFVSLEDKACKPCTGSQLAIKIKAVDYSKIYNLRTILFLT